MPSSKIALTMAAAILLGVYGCRTLPDVQVYPPHPPVVEADAKEPGRAWCSRLANQLTDQSSEQATGGLTLITAGALTTVAGGLIPAAENSTTNPTGPSAAERVAPITLNVVGVAMVAYGAYLVLRSRESASAAAAAADALKIMKAAQGARDGDRAAYETCISVKGAFNSSRGDAIRELEKKIAGQTSDLK